MANTGDDTLEVLIGRIPCACLVSAKKNLLIAPGKTVPFEVTFDSSNYAGKISKQIPIISSNKLIKLQFEAFVYDLFKLSNKRKYLGEILAGEQTKTSIEVASQYIDPSIVKLILPKVKDPNRLSFFVKDRTSRIHEKAKKTCKMELSIDTPTHLGKILEEVAFTAKDPNSKKTVINKVQFGAIIIDPYINIYEIRFGVIFLGQSKKSLEKEFTLTSKIDPEDIQLKHTPKYVKVERMQIEEGGTKFRVSLETDKIENSGLIEDLLVLSYNSSGKTHVRSIPVSAMVIVGSL